MLLLSRRSSIPLLLTIVATMFSRFLKVPLTCSLDCSNFDKDFLQTSFNFNLWDNFVETDLISTYFRSNNLQRLKLNSTCSTPQSTQLLVDGWNLIVLPRTPQLGKQQEFSHLPQPAEQSKSIVHNPIKVLNAYRARAEPRNATSHFLPCQVRSLSARRGGLLTASSHVVLHQTGQLNSHIIIAKFICAALSEISINCRD